LKRSSCKHLWPIDEKAASPPGGWTEWPGGKQFALLLTHDVETVKGIQKSMALAELEERLGFRSSFNFVVKDYNVPPELKHYLGEKGFEVGVHGLYHDVRLFSSEEIFQKHASEINQYLSKWGSVGFRAPSMYHNLEWINALDVEYDSSTFDTDPFEPQPDGVGTIFPFWVQDGCADRGFIELPYTLPQDFTLFVLMRERNIDIWRKKLDWIVEKGGMALFITHPDYMNFDGKKPGMEEYAIEFYEAFLGYIKNRYWGQYWHVLPREMARFWKAKMVIPNSSKSTE
jgi:hypothetical protein